MEIYKSFIHQYCPVLSKNVAIEKTVDSSDSICYKCLNKYECNFIYNSCKNKLVAEIQSRFF